MWGNTVVRRPPYSMLRRPCAPMGSFPSTCRSRRACARCGKAKRQPPRNPSRRCWQKMLRSTRICCCRWHSSGWTLVALPTRSHISRQCMAAVHPWMMLLYGLLWRPATVQLVRLMRQSSCTKTSCKDWSLGPRRTQRRHLHWQTCCARWGTLGKLPPCCFMPMGWTCLLPAAAAAAAGLREREAQAAGLLEQEAQAAEGNRSR
mmetsp:Transcript_13702/g.41390  ORF Transcript_13702/g.41390 Transcript_13702/m.41390 type:complete len:204 (+) Transcript_13702:742-1353(+)